MNVSNPVSTSRAVGVTVGVVSTLVALLFFVAFPRSDRPIVQEVLRTPLPFLLLFLLSIACVIWLIKETPESIMTLKITFLWECVGWSLLSALLCAVIASLVFAYNTGESLNGGYWGFAFMVSWIVITVLGVFISLLASSAVSIWIIVRARKEVAARAQGQLLLSHRKKNHDDTGMDNERFRPPRISHRVRR